MTPHFRSNSGLFRSAAVLATALGLAGCSTPGGWFGTGYFDSRPKPAPLPVLTSNAGSIAWSASVGKSDGYMFVPAVGEKLIYAANYGETVFALADEGGRTVTRIDTKAKLSAGVGFSDDLVVVVTVKGDVAAFDPSGRSVWKTPLLAEILAPPTIAGGIVIVRTTDGRMIALNRTDGKRKWLFSRPTPSLTLRSNAGVIVNRGVVYAGYPGGKLIAIELESGRPVWEATISLPRGATELERVADVSGLPVLDETRVCAAVYQGRTSCVETLNGNVLWARDIPSADGVAIDAKQLYVVDAESNLLALEKVTGATMWKQDKLRLRDIGTPALLNGRILSGDRDGLVHIFNAESGDIVGRVATDGSRVVSLLVAGDKAIAQTAKGGVYAIAVK
jgi:outer membrane protein assembly factor BamB